MNSSRKIHLLGTLLFLTIILSYIFSEDTLGGAKEDYSVHENFIVLFAGDFFDTFKNYGLNGMIRNSPIFYILQSLFYKSGLDLNSLRYLNIISVYLIAYLFFTCLKIQFKNVKISTLKIFTLVLLLSPTVRSLAVWPYPIFYAFILFLLSIKYYLLFCADKKKNLKYPILNIFFVAAASYITPNFSVFSIFFIYNFFLEYKFSKKIGYLAVINLVLALPALIYYYNFDFYLLDVSLSEVDYSIKYNIFNKIILIISIIFFYYLPFLNKKICYKFFFEIKNLKKNYIIIFIFLNSIIFYNFPNNFGGGVFYHISNKIFSNSIFLFLVFLVSLYIFKASKIYNTNNIILFICLILYNIQTSIYHKYFDPLLLFVLLFLFSFHKSNVKINIKELSKRFYYLYFIFLGMSFYKISFLI